MTKYLPRKCPKCHDYFFCVAIGRPPTHSRGLPITAFCAVCGYQLRGWRLILGRKREPEVRYGRMPKVFR